MRSYTEKIASFRPVARTQFRTPSRHDFYTPKYTQYINVNDIKFKIAFYCDSQVRLHLDDRQPRILGKML